MSIMVIAGKGIIGDDVVRGLLARGEAVCVLMRSLEEADALPPGVKGVFAVRHKPETLPWAMKGIDRVCLIPSNHPIETEHEYAIVGAAHQAGVRHFVYLSVYGADRAPHVPYFRSKLEIEKALMDSGMPFTVIMPNNLFQYDLTYRSAIVEKKHYPQPIGDIGLNRVDARDVSDAIIAALTQAGHEFHKYPLVGLEALTGQDVAQIYSHYLGDEILYTGDLEAWTQDATYQSARITNSDSNSMYAFIQSHGLRANEEDFARQAKIIARPPRSFHTFARDTIGVWTNTPSENLLHHGVSSNLHQVNSAALA
jgi:uncharacterized protein YbjT (DUF2867 family)